MALPDNLDKNYSFRRKNILEEQKKKLERFKEQKRELRKAIEQVASTPSGDKLLKFIFLLCGGSGPSLRRSGKDSTVDIQETLATLGAKAVYEELRANMNSETVVNIEKRNWENQE